MAAVVEDNARPAIGNTKKADGLAAEARDKLNSFMSMFSDVPVEDAAGLFAQVRIK